LFCVRLTRVRLALDSDDDACTVCGGAGDLVLCDDCPRAWHLHCSVPVLDAVPEGDWTCAACRGEARRRPARRLPARRPATSHPASPLSSPSRGRPLLRP